MKQVAHRTPCLMVAMAAALAGCASAGSQGFAPSPATASARPSMVGVVGTPTVVPFTQTRDGLGDAARHYDVAKYWLAQGRSALALEALNRALASEPRHVESLNARASIRANSGDLPGAQADLQAALSLAPERAHLHYNLGVLKRMNQDSAGARTAFQQALTLDPAHDGARAALALQAPALPAAATSEASFVAASQTPAAASVAPAVSAVSAVSAVFVSPSVSAKQPPSVAQPGAFAPRPDAAAEARAPRAVSLSGDKASLSFVQPGSNPSATAHAALVTVPPLATLPARPVVALTDTSASLPSSVLAQTPVPTPTETATVVQRIATMPDPAPNGLQAAQPVEPAASSLIRLPTAVGAQLVYPQQPATEALAATDARIDIANGNGVNGLAKALRAQLRGNGLTTASISNWSNFDQRVTRVYYREGFEQTAQALARRLPVSATVSPLQGPSQRDVVVVLGRDMRSYRLTSAGWVENIASLEPGLPALGG